MPAEVAITSIASSAASTARFDVDATFRVMTTRRLQRGLGGSVSAPRASRMLSVLGFALLACGLVSISFTSAAGTTNSTQVAGDTGVYLNLNLDFTDNILLITIAVVLIFAALIVIETVRMCVYWLSCGLLAYVVLVIACPNAETCPQRQEWSTAIVSIVLGLMGTTVLLWLAIHRLYPACLARACCCLRDVVWWWGIQPAVIDELSEGSGHLFTYRPESRHFPGGLLGPRLTRALGLPERHFGYSGGLDADGRPHGWGTWHDSAAHGEKLVGFWRHGAPIAPFHAPEYVSGWTFKAVRIAYCHNRMEPGLDEYWWSARRNPGGLSWGVASVECSVAGGFFKHLPAVVSLCGPELQRSASWCREQMAPRELADSSMRTVLGERLADASQVTLEDGAAPDAFVVTAGGRGLRVGGFTPVGPREAQSVTIHWEPPPTGVQRQPSEMPTSPTTRGAERRTPSAGPMHSAVGGRLRLGGAEPDRPGSVDWTVEDASGPPAEAVVFVHGFNSPVADALKRVAQLWTLGSFPPHLHCYCFGWPGARDVRPPLHRTRAHVRCMPVHVANLVPARWSAHRSRTFPLRRGARTTLR